MPEKQAEVTNVRLGLAWGPNPTIWLEKPMLGEKPGQEYIGRVIVEIWSGGESIAYGSFTANQVLALALRSLQTADPSNVVLSAPWSEEPTLGSVPDQTYQGRVVIELWSQDAVIAASGVATAATLLRNAANRVMAAITAAGT